MIDMDKQREQWIIDRFAELEEDYEQPLAFVLLKVLLEAIELQVSDAMKEHRRLDHVEGLGK